MHSKLDRREMLRLMGQTAMGAVLATGIQACSHAGSTGKRPAEKSLICKPAISGALWSINGGDLAAWSEDRLRAELTEQRVIGFNLIWLSYTATVIDAPGDPIKQLLDLCAKRRVQVIMDVNMSPSWYTTIDLKPELELVGKHISAMQAKYGGHPAFYAWYIPQEVYMSWGYAEVYQNALYSGIVELCKKASKLPVALSPFFILDRNKVFGDFRYAEPEEYYSHWRDTLKKSGIDIIMLQDSGEHFSYVTMDQRRPFFSAMKAACDETKTKLWGNVETAEYVCDSIDEYIKLYGRIHHSTAPGLPWRAVPIDRLIQKLELAAEYCERIVCWGYYEFCKPSVGADAAKWYQDYLGYYKKLR